MFMFSTVFMRTRILFATVSLLFALAPWCGASAETLRTVTSVINGKSFQLENGSTVRLASIQAPNVAEPGGRPGEPMGEVAKGVLERLILHHKIRIGSGKDSVITDRHGRLVGQVYLEDGRWVQGELLKAGMAMVYSFPDQRDYVEMMLALERDARAAGRGIWSDPYFAIIPAEEAGKYMGRFKLVEGVVQDVASVKGTTYLNFGADWKTDFTVLINKESRKRFIKPLSLAEKARIRVRGWIFSNYGPSIEVDHPEQLEFLD